MKKTDNAVLLPGILISRLMKIYALLVVFTITKIFAADISGQKITVQMSDVELKTILSEIEDQANFSFFYNNNLVDVSEKASLNVTNENLQDALESLLNPTSIDYRFVKNQIVLFPKDNPEVAAEIDALLEKISEENMEEVAETTPVATLVTAAQQNVITGNVSNEMGPIPGATVVVKGTSRGVTTDFDGNYSIEASQGEELEFSYVGMKTVTITVASNNVIDVVLEDDNVLEEVIVVAYGTAKKSDYTGSATQINNESIENRPVSNITSAIEGNASGVTVSPSSGQPGSTADIRIRGYGSVAGSNSPLYVVDGIPFGGQLSSINPADIESITVLKDAGSTALYGNLAANGVVMITTKKGRNRKGQMSFRASGGVVSRAIPEYDRLGPDRYYEVMWESMRNSQAIPGVDSEADVAAANQFATDNIINELGNNPYNVADDAIVGIDGKLNPNASLLYPDDLDWTDAVTQTGVRQNYDLSYMGGTENMDYFVSMGYLKEEGFIKWSDFNRLTGRAKVNYQASKRIKTGLNLAATNSRANIAQAQATQSNSFRNPVRYTRNMGPIYNIHKHDPVTGEYILDENGNKIYELDDNRPAGANPGRHIVAEMDWNQDMDEITSLSARSYLDVMIIDGLVFTLNATLDQTHRYTTQFDNPLVGDGAPGGTAEREYDRVTTIGFNQLLKYNKVFNDVHRVSALLGHESIERKDNNFYGRRSEMIADNNTELINFVNIQDLESVTDTRTQESYFSSVTYDYDEKYYVSGSFRTDGTSKFHPDTRWGNFWSIGASWRMDNEDFMADVDWVNMLKIRGSYGEIGNNRGISWYAYQGLYDLGYNNQTEPGVRQATLASPLLTWEASRSFDIAAEFNFWGRLDGVVEYYHRISDNLLFDVPLPLSSGVEDVPMNIGTMFNKGIELSLNYDIFQKEDFNWNFGVIFTTIKNEFTELPQEEIITGSKKLMVGRSLYDYWLRQYEGVDPADGAALYVPTPEAIDNDGSDIREIDGTKYTTTLSNAAYGYVGTAIPDFAGSFTNAFRYKNFNLNFMFTYQVGGKTLDYNFRSIMSTGDYGNALSTEIEDRWQQPGDITNTPRMDASQQNNFDGTSSRWLYDASYLNLRQLTFSYDLPRDMLEKAGIATTQVYLSGENLLFFNERKGMDVQESFNGTTSNVYTPSQIWSLGINLNF